MTKNFTKSTSLSEVMYRKIKASYRALYPRGRSMQSIFSEIYEKNLWADEQSVSGRGSRLERTEAIRLALPTLLKDLNAQTLLDIPCGDFNWMQHTKLGQVRYIGADVVPSLIARNQRLYGKQGTDFTVLDVTRDGIPLVDAILCRDCFIHLSFADINGAVANFKRSGAEYLMATTHTSVNENEDIATGAWRSINLLRQPFSFPAPLTVITEDSQLGKCLGVWRIDEL